MSYGRYVPKDAETIAAVLSKADAEYAALKGDSDKSDEVKAGDFLVTFRFSAQYGFSISVRPSDRMGGMESISMTREQAAKVQKFFAMGTKLAAVLGAMIKS
jgi:hypothetical protein